MAKEIWDLSSKDFNKFSSENKLTLEGTYSQLRTLPKVY